MPQQLRMPGFGGQAFVLTGSGGRHGIRTADRRSARRLVGGSQRSGGHWVCQSRSCTHAQLAQTIRAAAARTCTGTCPSASSSTASPATPCLQRQGAQGVTPKLSDWILAVDVPAEDDLPYAPPFVDWEQASRRTPAEVRWSRPQRSQLRSLHALRQALPPRQALGHGAAQQAPLQRLQGQGRAGRTALQQKSSGPRPARNWYPLFLSICSALFACIALLAQVFSAPRRAPSAAPCSRSPARLLRPRPALPCT